MPLRWSLRLLLFGRYKHDAPPDLRSPLKLVQETSVVFVEKANVVDLVTDHGDGFDAEAEGPAAPDFGIVADVFENFRMHHAAAGNLHPIFAESSYKGACEIDFQAR